MKLRFRHYGPDSSRYPQNYGYGFNIWRASSKLPTLDIMFGKHVFVFFWISKGE